MQESILGLQKEFERINNLGWIKEKRRGKGAAGYTFEELLKKEEDNFPIPDYNDIEIKTMNQNTKTNLHLFNLTPDGDYLFPIMRMLDELGCPDKLDKKLKTFYRSFNARDYTPIIYGRKGKLIVDYDNKKVKLIVINNKQEDINIGISWSFDYLYERLQLKLNYLALIRVSSCFMFNEGYYRYDTIAFYKLKSFDIFLQLINKGIIEITFKIGVHKDAIKYGKVYDHGTDFSINVNDIEKLYDKLC